MFHAGLANRRERWSASFGGDGGADGSDGEGEEEEEHVVDLPVDPPSDSDHADDETLVLGGGSPKNTGDSDLETDGEGSPVDKAPMSPMSPGDVGFGGDIGGYDPSSDSAESSNDESPNEPSGSKGPLADLPPMPLSDDERYITPATKEKTTKRPLPHDGSSQKDAKKQRPVDACLQGLTMVDGFPSGFHTGFFMLMHLHMVSLLLNTVMVVQNFVQVRTSLN